MAELRAYYYNGGDMLELVRYQKQGIKKAAGAENDIISSTQIQQSEKSRHGKLGEYVEAISHRVSIDIKKKVYFNEQIWGL